MNSDLYNHTPNLQVDILREQAKLYGVSESRILTLLHDAYSQNYSYLIKKPTDQYQVILEVADDKRSDLRIWAGCTSRVMTVSVWSP